MLNEKQGPIQSTNKNVGGMFVCACMQNRCSGCPNCIKGKCDLCANKKTKEQFQGGFDAQASCPCQMGNCADCKMCKMHMCSTCPKNKDENEGFFNTNPINAKKLMAVDIGNELVCPCPGGNCLKCRKPMVTLGGPLGCPCVRGDCKSCGKCRDGLCRTCPIYLESFANQEQLLANSCPCLRGACKNCRLCLEGKCPYCKASCPCMSGNCKQCVNCRQGRCKLCPYMLEGFGTLPKMNINEQACLNCPKRKLYPCSCMRAGCPLCNQTNDMSIDLPSFGTWHGGNRLGNGWNEATPGLSPINLTESLVYYPDSYVGSYFTNPKPDIMKPYPFMPYSEPVSAINLDMRK